MVVGDNDSLRLVRVVPILITSFLHLHNISVHGIRNNILSHVHGMVRADSSNFYRCGSLVLAWHKFRLENVQNSFFSLYRK